MAAAVAKSAAAAHAAHSGKNKKKKDKEPADIEEKVVEEEIDEGPLPTGFWKYQPATKMFYTTPSIEWSVAGLIMANFLTNIVEKTIDPEKTETQSFVWTWFGFGLFYNIIFTFELGINMYSMSATRQMMRAWWANGWNVFDFIVVSIGLMGYVAMILPIELPPPLKLLRMMRAFRVFRLFKRVKSLNKIITSLARAMPGVGNAFLILLLVMCIYAILAVEFFKYFDNPKFTSARGELLYKTHGQEYFGNFARSLYTLFQVLTGDSWSEAIGRPLMEGGGWFSTMFFVSFILINAVVLINVVVAVLLEKMVDPEEEDSSEKEELDEIEGDMEDLKTALDCVHAEVSMTRSFLHDELHAIRATLQQLCEAQGLHVHLPAPPQLPPVPLPAPRKSISVDASEGERARLGSGGDGWTGDTVSSEIELAAPANATSTGSSVIDMTGGPVGGGGIGETPVILMSTTPPLDSPL